MSMFFKRENFFKELGCSLRKPGNVWSWNLYMKLKLRHSDTPQYWQIYYFRLLSLLNDLKCECLQTVLVSMCLQQTAHNNHSLGKNIFS